MNRRLLLATAMLALAVGVPACKPGAALFVEAPTFKYVQQKQGGCADIYLFTSTSDNLEVLWISAEKEKLKLPAKGSITFELAEAPDGLQVAVDLWEKAPKFPAYCNDISADTRKKATWTARKGKVTITILDAVDPDRRPGQYKARVNLDQIEFQHPAGHRATMDKELTLEATVGLYAG